jgi:hypothetical protein
LMHNKVILGFIFLDFPSFFGKFEAFRVLDCSC